MRGLVKTSHLLHSFTLKKKKLERRQVEPFVKYITRVELFGLNERVIEEAKIKSKGKTKEEKKKTNLHALEQWFFQAKSM